MMSTNNTTPKPVYILVDGVSHTPIFWTKVIQHMSGAGYRAEAVAYPICGENTENAKLSDEVIAIQNAVLTHLDAGSDVILVMHSYGGWPGSRAIKGLDKETRLENGHSTGIVEVVFVAAFLLPDNAPIAMWSYLPEWLTVKDGRRIPNERYIPLLMDDLNEKDQQYWFSQLEWQRNDFTAETVPDAPWKLSIPKTYIITARDKAAVLEWQLPMLQTVMLERPDT